MGSLLLIASLSALAGCGGETQGARAKEQSHIRAITGLYAKVASDLGRDPADEQQFKGAISQTNFKPEVFGVENIDELFVSERDGQPLVIVYGKPPKGLAPGVIAYEQVGVDGVRLVGFKIGQVEEADAARFAELVPAGASAPTAPN